MLTANGASTVSPLSRLVDPHFDDLQAPFPSLSA
jgi:hypothetical protein